MKSITKLLIIISIIAVFLIGCTANESSAPQVEEDTQPVAQTQQVAEEEQDDAHNQAEDTTVENANDSVETTETKPEAVKVEEKVEPQTASEPETNNNTEPTKPVEQSSTKQPTVTKKPDNTNPPSSSQEPSSQPVAEQPKEQVKPKEEKLNTVTMTIKGDAETGVILSSTKVEIKSGDTVLNVLKKVTKEKRIHMEYQGSGPTAYIEGINNLYEFDKGPKSGWMYSVNSDFQRNGAGVAEVKPDDEVQWIYTLDLGRDVGANWQ